MQRNTASLADCYSNTRSDKPFKTTDRHGYSDVGFFMQVDGWTGGRVDGWTGGRVDGWTGGRVDGWTVFMNNKKYKQYHQYIAYTQYFIAFAPSFRLPMHAIALLIEIKLHRKCLQLTYINIIFAPYF